MESKNGGGIMENILIVEDDSMLNSGLCYNLRLDRYRAVPARGAAEALERIKAEPFDLAVLDVNLPDGNGFDLCREIRAARETPVIFLTARDLESDVMKGFELGVDDYVTKPFSVNVFRKKVAAVLRRCKNREEDAYRDGDLTVDFGGMTASAGGRSSVLTPTECRLLKLFTANPGTVLTRRTILEKLWDCEGDFVDEHALTVYINRLRGKVESGERKHIRTVYGMGYLWVGEKT